MLETQVNKLPSGTLICTQNKKYTKWYHRDGSNFIYLKKKKRKLAEQLALKKYCILQLQDLLHEKVAIQMYLNYHEENENNSSQLLLGNSKFHALLKPYFIAEEKELLDWTSAFYERNEKYPEQLIHKSISGNILRSKSEVLIDMILYQNKIPYRYECPIIIDNIRIYPDFTIRHPKTGQIFYWEHFGMMDDRNYAKNACNKLNLYCSSGLFPSIHIITTYESDEFPLTSDLIQHIVEYYFL